MIEHTQWDTKTKLVAMAGAMVLLIDAEYQWHREKPRQVLLSPSRDYIATVRTIHYYETALGTEIFVRPKWMPSSAIGAIKVFEGYCGASIEWKADDELHVDCPMPEGLPQIHLHPWQITISVNQHFPENTGSNSRLSTFDEK